ncbi:MAG: class I SAM-dependent methyltransferase [Anaerolineae bacterium]
MPERITFCDPNSLEADYLAAFLAERRVPQNLFYLLNGADSFYSYRNADLAEIAWQDEYRFFKEKGLWSRTQRVGFVSLGCGNAGPEKMLLRHLAADGYDIHYIGVDSSEKMLQLAADNLGSETFEQTYVLADILRPDFIDRLWCLATPLDVRIYAMIGGTFGNFDQVQIAGFLSRLTRPGDYVYLDVVPTYNTDEANSRLRSRLARVPETLRGFFDRLLAALGLSRADGEMVSVESRDGAVNTVRYTYTFRALRRITLSCLGEQLALEPGDEIELLSVRAYDIASLISFLDLHSFEFVDTYVPDVGGLGHLWQRLLFVKAEPDSKREA